MSITTSHFEHTRAAFYLPDGLIYLDGNSLGPMPLGVPGQVNDMLTGQWAEMLIRGWNDADWMTLPGRLGDRVAALIGAQQGTVTMGDTLSIKVYQALGSALELQPERRVVLSDTGNFPTDLYMARGLLESLDKDYILELVEPDDVVAALDESVAVLLLTQVDYRTGRIHDMEAVTRAAHAKGVVVIWDLAHSAGAIPVALDYCDVDFAVGCTYKYLNGGPGAPAFIYVNQKHLQQVQPVLPGWLGHARPFDFDLDYQPGVGIDRMRVGTPPVLALTTLEASLAIWETVTLDDVREQSIALSERFIKGVEAECPQLKLISPRDPALRGSQVSFRFEQGYAVMQALIAEGVIGDFRAPDIIRFGITPLYISMADIDRAIAILAEIMSTGKWDDPKFKVRSAVT